MEQSTPVTLASSPREKTSKIVFIFSLLISGLISLLFLAGTINPDFFSFLYIGQGVLEGGDMYRDFADNKGPVLYLFFALLRLLFGEHFGAMLVIGSAALDGITAFLLFKIITDVWHIKLPTRTPLLLLILLGAVAWVKSFSMGPLPGGVFSENIAIPLLLGSVLLTVKNKPFAGGLVFALSVLTRLTSAFFIIYLFALLLQQRNKKNLLLFFVGTLTPTILFSMWFFVHGSFSDFINHMLLWNISYGYQTTAEKIASIFGLARMAPHVGLSWIIVGVGTLIATLTQPASEKRIALALYVSSLLSITAAGIFYIHHAMQLILAFFFSLTLISRLIWGRTLTIVCVTLFSLLLPLNYAAYAYNGGPLSRLSLQHTPPVIKEIENLPYLHMIGDPRYYFLYHKKSPDPYFIPDMLKSSLSAESQRNIEHHKALSPELIKKTAFIAVEQYAPDIKATQEYLDTFSQTFALVERARYFDGDARITVFVSELP